MKSNKDYTKRQSKSPNEINVFNNAAGLSNIGADQTNAGLNFIAARLTVGAINLAVFAHMSVPVLTFAAALSQEPALKFTVVKPQVPENGDMLTYKAENSNRSVTYLDQSANPAAAGQIFWDDVTYAGYLIAPNYNNGQKSCWDSQLNDMTCQ